MGRREYQRKLIYMFDGWFTNELDPYIVPNDVVQTFYASYASSQQAKP